MRFFGPKRRQGNVPERRFRSLVRLLRPEILGGVMRWLRNVDVPRDFVYECNSIWHLLVLGILVCFWLESAYFQV